MSVVDCHGMRLWQRCRFEESERFDDAVVEGVVFKKEWDLTTQFSAELVLRESDI